MELIEYIDIRPDVMMGKACLKGTRIPVYLILEKLAAGEAAGQILKAYPQMIPQHVTAALQYAANENLSPDQAAILRTAG